MPNGISYTGFSRKRQEDILAELEAQLKAIFGDNLNTSPESPDGQMLGVLAESFSNLWQLGQAAYDSYNPSAAVGAALANIALLNGITQLDASPSVGVVTLTGVSGTFIPAGSLVATNDTGVKFTTAEDRTIPAGGSIDVGITAVDTGPIPAVAGTITIIDTPITGWNAVTNSADVTLGRNKETDVELRARRAASVARDAQNIIEAIFAEVASVAGVTQVSVLENDTNSPSGTLPANSFTAVVVGGLDAEIARAVFLKKPAGILAAGNVTIQVPDSQGFTHDISFTRPTEIPIYVTVNITAFSNFPSNGVDKIKQNIVDYANGQLVEGRGFGLGDYVIYSEMYTPVNAVVGHQVDSLYIGTSPSPTGTSNIVIQPTEISVFTIANIVVNV